MGWFQFANIFGIYLAVCQNLVPLVNIKIAGKWMFIPLKMVLIGIDPYPFESNTKSYQPTNCQPRSFWDYHPHFQRRTLRKRRLPRRLRSVPGVFWHVPAHWLGPSHSAGEDSSLYIGWWWCLDVVWGWNPMQFLIWCKHIIIYDYIILYMYIFYVYIYTIIHTI